MRQGQIFWGEIVGFYAPVEEPVVILRDRRVLDASASARARGIVRGMTVPNVRSLLPEATHQAWKREEYVERQFAWLNVCARFSGTVEPEDQHSAYLDLSLHPDVLEVTEQLVRELIDTTGLPLRYGLSPVKWIAKLAAEAGHDAELARSDPALFLDPLPVTMLSPVSWEHRERLKFLGCRTIGDVARMSVRNLVTQFGQEGIAIRQFARGGGTEAVQALYPLDAIGESFRFENSVEDLQVIDRTLRKLAERLAARLVERDSQGSKLEATIEFDAAPSLVLSRQFTRPIRCFATALAAMRLLLEGVVQEAVTGIRVLLPDVQRTSRAQRGLLESSERPKMASAVNYVRTVYGDNAVQLAGEKKNSRRVSVLREWMNATRWT